MSHNGQGLPLPERSASISREPGLPLLGSRDLDAVENQTFANRRFITEDQMSEAMKDLKKMLADLRAEVATLKERRPQP